MKQYVIKVYGRVQGVGFRYFTERIAKQYRIVGTVANVNDYVEVHAQGDVDELESFIKSVTNGASPASSVSSYTIDEETVNHTFKNFRAIS
ncbi:acylphosphatase [Staphylococcus felis]|uniref:acylphosphatase n=1 Tax=Staphylococcus felis TaxID=46127 RepID=A0A3E0ISW1_9STAP|nr:acylphosphatase [Staphylococcus felis]REH87534.1 acylphosphatase [Staphylococcus felis]REH89341.1 acylphosphatase [Staphylococcus felis]REI01072.1 acylphosphatase [Staphylococcus felis]